MKLQQEIDKLALQVVEVSKAARTDNLTPLGNALALTEQSQRCLSEGRYYYFFGDINGFKLINDTHSHAAGNAALTAVGESLQLRCKAMGAMAFRKSGDEFVLLVPEQSVEGGVQ